MLKRDTSAGFDPVVPGDVKVVVPAVEALRLDGMLESSILSPAMHRVLLAYARQRNAVSTMAIEGVNVGLDAVRAMLAAEEPRNQNEAQLLTLLKRLQWLHDTPWQDLPDPSWALAQELHAELFPLGVEGHALGEPKREQNVIRDEQTGLVIFTPTPPERVADELNALFAWYRRPAGTRLPAVTAALLFAEFQAIHPFADGNGRVGRLLNLIALKRMGHRNVGLVPLDARFFRTHDAYYEKLRSTNDGQTWHVWAGYYVRELRRAYEVTRRRGDLQPLIDRQTITAAKHILFWALQRDPAWFKRGDFPNESGHSSAALTNGLGDLCRQGVLEMHGTKKGARYRVRTDFLEAVYREDAVDAE